MLNKNGETELICYTNVVLDVELDWNITQYVVVWLSIKPIVIAIKMIKKRNFTNQRLGKIQQILLKISLII